MDTHLPQGHDTNREAALRGLYEDLARHNLFPFWATSKDTDHDEIRQLMATRKAGPSATNPRSTSPSSTCRWSRR